jgi:biotin carboxyl carrier protein
MVPTEVRAQITGTVWKIQVGEGDPVEPGQVVVLLESMKMELPVPSPVAGRVRRILVAEGQAVEDDELLLTVG